MISQRRPSQAYRTLSRRGLIPVVTVDGVEVKCIMTADTKRSAVIVIFCHFLCTSLKVSAVTKDLLPSF